MTTLLDEFMGDALLAPCAFDLAAPGCRFSTAQPLIQAADDKYTVTITAPGVAASDIEVEFGDGRALAVRGVTEAEAHSHFVNYEVAMPPDAEVEHASAEYADGLLTVVVPRKAAPAPTRISVSTSADVSIDGYKITVVAAGVAAADLELSADKHKGVLTVNGATARTGVSISRAYRLPRDADVASALAAHVDGILTVCVPKKALSEPRKLKIVPAAAEAPPAATTETAES